MTDNELVKLFGPIIEAGLLQRGFTGVKLLAANQPTTQGLLTAPTVYFYKIGDHRFGFLQRTDEWNSLLNQMDHQELQNYETTFQVSALVLQTPPQLITTGYTASDLVNEVSGILQSDSARNTLAQQNVGVLRITDIRNPYFVDDRDTFEASPSFDFVLTHSRIYNTTTPTATPVSGIYGI